MLSKETVYKDIHIHVLSKQLKDKTESIATAIDYNQYIEYAKRGKYAYNNMLTPSHSWKIVKKAQYASMPNDSWEDYQDIQKANKINWQKGALVKTEEQKYTS